jgi:hypothetical protein
MMSETVRAQWVGCTLRGSQEAQCWELARCVHFSPAKIGARGKSKGLRKLRQTLISAGSDRPLVR